MNKEDISKAKNPDLRASLVALERAAQSARFVAMQTNTSVVLVENGKMIKISAEQLRQEVCKS
ncbi:hypothetical protein DUD43_08610 [Alcaligenes faecalis]|uniref:hypothetical protein n=1 Tax=Alcaligenes faecalis TaxID=511 RepID=UPI001293747E|nr:hypothetical protein [Alcaligenes faecalis]QFY77737.1 hypothetical protein DUD43_08610 [Alcaligenes faecalis]